MRFTFWDDERLCWRTDHKPVRTDVGVVAGGPCSREETLDTAHTNHIIDSADPLQRAADLIEPHKKFDEGKRRYTLVPPQALAAVARVLTHGAEKYGDDNWRKAFPGGEDRYLDATLRHIEAWRMGERQDESTGESHLAHAVCSLLFVLNSEEVEGG